MSGDGGDANVDELVIELPIPLPPVKHSVSGLTERRDADWRWRGEKM